MPYEKGDTIIFQSKRGEFDTIYILEKKIWYSDYNWPEQHGKYNPQLGNLYYYNSKVPYIDQGKSLIEMYKNDPKEPADVTFNFYNSIFFLKEDNFHFIGSFKSHLGIVYKDVFRISKIEEQTTSSRNNNKPSVLYWSKSFGLIRYETYSNEIWELLEIRN